MPVTIYDSDLARARMESGTVILHYEGKGERPMYYLIEAGTDGGEIRRYGPFEHEDVAVGEAESRFGPLEWSAR